MRQLSPEEIELWARVTATIAPLSREKVRQQAPENKEERIPAVATVATRRVAPSAARRLPQLGTTLDSSWDRRLRSGSIELDRVIDLHGMNLDQAWRAIDRGLEQSIGRGDRVILLITG